MIVTNTVTGLAIPSLDALLLNGLKLAPTIERLPMFGLGCGAGVAGLSRAARLAHAKDGALVLFLTVDLCSLCLRVNDPSPAMFVSTALFGDGAAGLLLHNTRSGARSGPRILTSEEWCWGNTEHIMGWDIKDDGFGIVLSPELPSLMKKALAYPQWWTGKRFDRPTIGWACGVTGEVVRDTVQRVLVGRSGQIGTGAIPKDAIGELVAARGIPDLLDHIKVQHVSGDTSIIGL